MREEDPIEKSNHPSALCFTCKGQYLSLQPGSRDKPDKKDGGSVRG